MILAIDPGSEDSAYVVLEDDLEPIKFGKINNEELRQFVIGTMDTWMETKFAIEMIASYGMAVGKEVFETVFWLGRFWEAAEQHSDCSRTKVYRKEVKMNLCHSMKANDSNIIQALADRFAYGIPNKGKGTKKNPGPFFGFAGDIWQAYAVGVTYHDLYLKKESVKEVSSRNNCRWQHEKPLEFRTICLECEKGDKWEGVEG